MLEVIYWVNLKVVVDITVKLISCIHIFTLTILPRVC